MFPKKALSIAKHLLSNLTDPKLLNGSVYCYTQVVWISRPSSSGYFTCVVQHNQTFPATRLMLQMSSTVTSVIYVLTKVINSPHSCFYVCSSFAHRITSFFLPTITTKAAAPRCLWSCQL